MTRKCCGVKTIHPWYANMVNYPMTKKFPPSFFKAQRDKMASEAKHNIWDDPYLWKLGSDQAIRRCVTESEIVSILTFCHNYACGGHFGSKKTAMKVLDSGFYWHSLFRDAQRFCKSCDNCQRVGKITKRDEMHQQPMLYCDVFYV